MSYRTSFSTMSVTCIYQLQLLSEAIGR